MNLIKNNIKNYYNINKLKIKIKIIIKIINKMKIMIYFKIKIMNNFKKNLRYNYYKIFKEELIIIKD